MNINIVTGPFLPCGGGPAGAVEKCWLGLAQQFVRSGHRVTIVSREWPGLPVEENSQGVSIVRIGGYTRSRWVGLDLVKDMAYSLSALKLCASADITVINAFWLPLLAFPFKKRLGKIVVNVARFPKGQMGLYRKVDRLSAVSSAVANAIVSQAPSVQELVVTIPNPVDLELFHLGSSVAPRKNGFRILYTGRVHPEKGLHLLVSAAACLQDEFPKLELSIVGPVETQYGGGGQEYVAELVRLAAGMEIYFEPAINSPSSLAVRMREADYYCYPSLAEHGEAFGIAPLEAMALGFAPILSDLECFREFAVDGKNCFVFDHRSSNVGQMLIDALRRAMHDPFRTRVMGQCAANVAQKFGYSNVADMYLTDWKKLLN